MDNVTHTLAGAALADAFFSERLGNRAVPVLALASNLPDIDAVTVLFGRSGVLWRRTFGHSLLLVPLWAAALVWALRRWKYPDLSFWDLYPAVLVGTGVHLFMDLINSFGVVLFWPLSSWRPELAWVFIIDLVFTTLLAIPLLRRLRSAASWPAAHLARGALAAASAYLLLCGSSRALAMRQLRAAGPADFTYAFPEPLGPHRWRGVREASGIYYVYLLRPWSGAIEERRALRAVGDDPRIGLARATPLGRRLDWFFKAPVWTYDPQRGEAGAYDLRFASLVLGRKIPFLFRIPA